MIIGLAHTALHVTNVDEAVAWYADVLGLTVLSPPYRMEGDAIARDMGELLQSPAPVVVKAAIVGVDAESDRVIEVIEYPEVAPGDPSPAEITRLGFTHVALVCDDVATTRRDLEAKGVHFLVSGIADVAGLRTTWFADPWQNVFILVEKVRRPDRAYYRQFGDT
jgi:catechol 2,3-dioxygenase-like lactoylglutathione lyase family enzyme